MQVEIGAYDKAIETLTDLIKKDPRNKEAYYNRALAYFETGSFDQAIKDYLVSGKGKGLAKIESKVSNEFRDALLCSLAKGSMEAAVDFVPSLCNTVYGLGSSLWSLAEHSVDSTRNFCNACQEMGMTAAEYFKSLDWETMEGYAEEVRQLCEKFDQLSDGEKGHLIGYSIGRYGVDIFAGGVALKGVAVFKNLKNANRLCNLEAIAVSSANKEAILTSALKFEAERSAYFKNVRIHWDRQNKHIPGKHNFIVGDSTITIASEELEILIKQRAGSGQYVRGVWGEANYKERVDFGKIIGEYAVIKKGEPIKYIPTSKGIMHYANNGFVHVVPSDPFAIIN